VYSSERRFCANLSFPRFSQAGPWLVRKIADFASRTTVNNAAQNGANV
jgi:hypothetical protein